MKKLKRCIAVTGLIVMVLLVGCFAYTGKRLHKYPTDLEVYTHATFIANDDTIVAFTENGAWYGIGRYALCLLEITDYADGIITMERKEERYRFVAIDENTLYDEQTGKLLIRRGENDKTT